LQTLRYLLIPALTSTLVVSCDRHAPVDYAPGLVAEWNAYGGAPGGGHYSAAEQITRDNVHVLQQAWVYRTGDKREAGKGMLDGVAVDNVPGSSWQLTPLVVGDTLYGCSALNRMFALDAATGEEKWSYDPGVDTSQDMLVNCRGVSSWRSATPTGAACDHRIFMGTLDARLIAVDAKTGKACEDFGERGQVDLSAGLGRFSPQDYSVTSPPAILDDLVITGAMVLDRTHDHMPSGVVRAFDVRSGKLVWYWDAIPPGTQHEFDAQGQPVYHRGTTNVWSIISVDPERKLVFLPTGNTSSDFYGGNRKGVDDYYSSSVVALKGETGEVVWHFQMVHHDIWDYDTPAQPTLFDFARDGKPIPALAQPTTMGHLFLLNRETGEPLFPVEERPAPQHGAVPGEYLAATQPFPTKPAPLHPGGLTADDAWGFTFWDRGECRKQIEGLLNEGIFTPPSLQGSVQFPADMGGNNWGTPAIDPERGLVILNTLFMPEMLQLIPRDKCEIGKDPFTSPQAGTPYCVRSMPILSPLGAPCIAPPWSTLVAVDLATGEKRWEVPLGTLEEMAPWPLSRIKGAPSVGGPSVSAGGITFIAATPDYYLRAFDTVTGAELWKAKLPTGGHATPTIYRAPSDDRQFVVIAAGGHFGMPQEPKGDYLIAFALPKKPEGVTHP